MNVLKLELSAGQTTYGFTPRFAQMVFNGQPLFHHRSPFEFYQTTLRIIQSTDRYEYVVYDDERNIVASMAIYEEYDMHVGHCLSVLVAFSTDEHRRALVGGYKWLKELAISKGIEWIAYTKATSQYEMVLKYKRVSCEGSRITSNG